MKERSPTLSFPQDTNRSVNDDPVGSPDSPSLAPCGAFRPLGAVIRSCYPVALCAAPARPCDADTDEAA